MPISVATFLQPKNATHSDPALRNLNYVLEDIYFKGGFQVRANNEERDSIIAFNRKAGMAVLTTDTYKIWLLKDDLVTWAEFKAGSGGGSSAVVGERNQMSYTTQVIEPGAFEDFTLETGASIIANKIKMSGECELKVFADAAHADTNPYTFIALADHLTDDGSWVLEDGTRQYGRRYTVMMNGDVPETANLYFRITNLQNQATTFTLELEFLSLES